MPNPYRLAMGFLIALAASCLLGAVAANASEQYTIKVERVIDGDTVKLADGFCSPSIFCVNGRAIPKDVPAPATRVR